MSQFNVSIDNDELVYFLPSYWHYIIAGILTVCCLFGLIENVSVLIIFSKVKSLQSSTNMFIVSVAVADLLMCLLANPFVIASSISRIWIFGDNGCTYYGFIVYFLGLTSIFNLMTLSLDRYIVITKPITASKLNHKVAAWMIGACWIFGFFWALLPLLGWNSYGLEAANTSCSVVWNSKDPVRFSYNITIFFVSLVIPVSVMIFCYFRIFMKVRKVARGGTWNKKSRIAMRHIRLEKKLSKTILVMIGAFLMSWIPYAIVSFWSVCGDTKSLPVLVMTLPAILAKCASVWNPVIYVTTNKQFRKAFFNFLPCRKLRHSEVNKDIEQVDTDDSCAPVGTNTIEMKMIKQKADYSVR